MDPIEYHELVEITIQMTMLIGCCILVAIMVFLRLDEGCDQCYPPQNAEEDPSCKECMEERAFVYKIRSYAFGFNIILLCMEFLLLEGQRHFGIFRKVFATGMVLVFFMLTRPDILIVMVLLSFGYYLK